MNRLGKYFSISSLLAFLISSNISAQTPISVNTKNAAPGAGLTVNGAVVILREDQIQYDDQGKPVRAINEFGKDQDVREPRNRKGKFNRQYLEEMFNVTNPLLFVDGLVTKKARIYNSNIEWADYVFEDDYELMSLGELHTFLSEHKHLPAIPPASEVVANGYSTAEMHHNFLRTMEELTLHQIALNKEISIIKSKHSKYKEIANRVNKLKEYIGLTKISQNQALNENIASKSQSFDHNYTSATPTDKKGMVGINVSGLENNTVLNVSGRMVISNYDGAVPNLDESTEIAALASYEDDLADHEIVFPEDDDGNTIWNDYGLRKYGAEDFLVFVNGETVVTDYVSTYLTEEWDPQDVELGWIDHPLPIDQLEEFINENGRLPGIPSQQEILEESGYEVNAMNLTFKKTIENQFKYLIQQSNELSALKRGLRTYFNLENELASIKLQIKQNENQ